MAKTYSVNYGVIEIPFRYTMKERRELERQTGMGLMSFIRTRVLSLDDNGIGGGGILEDQIAFVHAGLKHSGPKITLKAIGDWFEELSTKPKGEDGQAPLFNVIGTAISACFASGVLGTVIGGEEEEEGKAEKETA